MEKSTMNKIRLYSLATILAITAFYDPSNPSQVSKPQSQVPARSNYAATNNNTDLVSEMFNKYCDSARDKRLDDMRNRSEITPFYSINRK